jgi:hypothetical protein
MYVIEFGQIIEFNFIFVNKKLSGRTVLLRKYSNPTLTYDRNLL